MDSPNSKTWMTLLVTAAIGVAAGCSADPSTSNAAPQSSAVQPRAKEEVSTSAPLFDESKLTAQKTIQRPKTFQGCVKKARKALKEFDCSAAVVYATFAIEMEPKRVEGYFLRGKARSRGLMDDTETAIKDLETAASIDNKEPEIFQQLAYQHNMRKDYDNALRAVNKAIEMDPRNRQLFEFRAGLYGGLGKRELALKDLTTCIKLRPQEMGHWVSRGKLYEALGKNEEALADYSKACELVSKDFKIVDAEVLKTRAGLLAKLGRHEEAIKDLSVVIKEIPEDDDALRLRGDEKASLAKYSEAIVDYTHAIELSPEYARASYEARARAYKKRGDTKLAEQDLQKAASLRGISAEKPVFDHKR